MDIEKQKLQARVEELSSEALRLAHTVTDLTAKLRHLQPASECCNQNCNQGRDCPERRRSDRRVVATLASPSPAVPTKPFDFHAHLARQAAWSEKTFGPGPRTKGVCDHIRKELVEVEADPLDLKEWVDVVILALDGAWRCGGKPDEIIAGIVAKQTKNEGRVWPDWRTADPDKAIEHDRSHDAQPTDTTAGE